MASLYPSRLSAVALFSSIRIACFGSVLLLACGLHTRLLGQVGIGTTTPDPSAQLELSTTTRGFLPPRLTDAEMTAIGSPAAGLVVFNTTYNRMYYYDAGSSQWLPVGSGLASGDNWGTQAAVATGFLTGDGTAGDPLRFVNGAGVGHVPTWNGTAWVSNPVSGDNLGNHTATTNLAMAGFEVRNTGNIGIGIAAPAAEIELNGTANRTIRMDRATLSDGNNLTIQAGGAAPLAITGEGGTLILASGIARGLLSNGSTIQFRTSNGGVIGDVVPTTKMVLNPVGNLGLGTTTPAAQLHTTGTVRHAGLGTTATLTGYQLAAVNIATGQVERYTGTLPGDNLGDHTATANVRLNGNWLSNDGDSEGVFVTPTGNVGIGTAAPTTILHLGGFDNVLTMFDLTPKNGINSTLGVIRFGDAQLTTAQAQIRAIRDAPSSGGTDLPTRLEFHTIPDGSNVIAERMRITSDGNLGLGTTTPAAQLHTTGAVRFEGLGTTASLTGYQLAAVNTSTGQMERYTGTLPGDNLGDHTATANVRLNGNWLSNDGGSEGIRVDNNGNVGINTATPNMHLDVNGNANVNGEYYIGGASMLRRPGFATVSVGFGAGNDTDENTFMGYTAGQSLTGQANAVYGAYAGLVGNGSFNTYIGVSTNYAGGNGSGNTYLGYEAGYSNIDGNNNTLLGRRTELLTNGISNAAAIGYLAAVSASNSLVLGSINGVNGATADVNVGIGTTFPMAQLHTTGSVRHSGIPDTTNQGSYRFLMVDPATGILRRLNGTLPGDNLGDHTATAQIQSTSGTAAAPGISFVGDLDNGIYSPATDELAISTNGTQRLVVDANGSVGVATAPTAQNRVTVQQTSTDANSSAITGQHTAITADITYGVVGTSASTNIDGAGVLGSTATAGQGVLGRNSGTFIGAVGVWGDASTVTAANPTYGVYGTTASTHINAAAIRGYSNTIATAVYGSSHGTGIGVRAEGFSSGHALVANATSSTGLALQANASGGRTANYAAAQVNNLTTSVTNGVSKTGLAIQSTGTWSGVGSVNRGLTVDVAGGTVNYAALFTGGNVGIGTTAPAARLHVSGAYANSFTAIPAAAVVTPPTNISHLRITSVAGVQANAISGPASPTEGQVLTIVNEDDNQATFVGSTIGANGGAASFVYANGQWRGYANTAGGGDNLGNHTATANITLGSNWLSGDGDSEGIRVDGGGLVGIGTHPSLYGGGLSIEMEESAGSIVLNQTGNSYAPQFQMIRNRGTEASPLPVLTGNSLGTFSFLGRSTTGNFLPGAVIEATAAQNFTSTTQSGTDLLFRTTPIGASTPVEHIRITADGNVGIGTSAPTHGAYLDIRGPNAFGDMVFKEGALVSHARTNDGGAAVVGHAMQDVNTFSASHWAMGALGAYEEIPYSGGPADVGVIGLVGVASPSFGGFFASTPNTDGSGRLELSSATVYAALGGPDAAGVFMGANVGIGSREPEGALDIVKTMSGNPQANFTGGAFPYGSEVSALVLNQGHSGDNSAGYGYVSSMIDFRGNDYGGFDNEASLAQIISTVDPNGGGSWSGGLMFATSPGGSTDPAGRRTTGAAPQFRMMLDHNGNLGIGTPNPAAQLHTTGSVRLTGLATTPTLTGYEVLARNNATGNVERYTGGFPGDNLGNHTATTQIQSTSGTAAAPGISFVGDLNMGLFRPAADQLAISTNGAQRMVVDANGNVGIGTGTPAYRLDVQSANPYTANFISTGTGGAAVYGSASGATGSNAGVWGHVVSPTDFSCGTYGQATNTTGRVFGVYGRTESGGTNAAGVYGLAANTTGQTAGVEGRTSSTNNNAAGVLGITQTAANGVFAYALSSAATGYALRAFTDNSSRTTNTITAIVQNAATSTTNGIAKMALDIQSTGAWTGANATNTGLNVNVGGATTNYAALFNGGPVGIGTTAPSVDLEVADDNYAEGHFLAHNNSGIVSGALVLGHARGSRAVPATTQAGDVLGQMQFRGYVTGTGWIGAASQVRADATQTWTGTQTGSCLIFSTVANNTSTSVERMRIDHTGFVGIGTGAPVCPLDINGGPSLGSTGGGRYFNSVTNLTAAAATPTSVSVRASGAFWSSGAGLAGGFYVSSDQRVKHILAVSDGRSDLERLMQIQVTDYQMRDSLAHGGNVVKGLIAQQVESVYPQAVTRQRNVIPNVYQHATAATANPEARTLALTLPTAPDLAPGDRVRLVTPTHDNLMLTVRAVEGNTLTVEGWEDTANPNPQVFVFGKEVDDFRIVDYDRVHTLGISAIQELARRHEALRADHDRLQEQLSAMATQQQQQLLQSQTTEQRLQALEALLARHANR